MTYPAVRRKFAAADIGVEHPIPSYNCSISRNSLTRNYAEVRAHSCLTRV